MSESRQTHVTLHDIDPQALEQLVQYAYTAEIVVGEGNVQVGTWSIYVFFFLSDPNSSHLTEPKSIQKTLSVYLSEIALFLDVTPSSQPATAQWGAGCLLQVPAQPTGPF